MLNIKTIKIILLWLIFFGFIIAIEYFFGWKAILVPWQTLSPPAIVIAMLLFLLSYQIRTWRLYDYFLPHTKGNWLTTLRLMLLHNILNNLLPARSGEVSFPLLMKRYFSVGYSHSLPALLWFRLLDLHTLLSVGAIAWIFTTSLTTFLCLLFGYYCPWFFII